MMPCDLSNTEANDRILEDLVEAGVYSSAEAGFDHGLVVLAMGLPYWLMAEEGRFRLLVPADEAVAVRGQLEIYDRESQGWPPPTPTTREEGGGAQRAGLFVPLVWACVVTGVFVAQGRWPKLTGAGALDARAVFDRGEIWRAATALFLHADLAHVTSNVLSGLFVCAAVRSAFGRWRGVALLGAAAVVGNLAVAAIHYSNAEAYRSIGASTAIFAGLGLLTGRAFAAVWGAERWQPWRAVLAPLAAGVTVLALFGAGEVRIDVLAHVTGFAAGLGAGWLAGRLTVVRARSTR